MRIGVPVARQWWERQVVGIDPDCIVLIAAGCARIGGDTLEILERNEADPSMRKGRSQ